MRIDKFHGSSKIAKSSVERNQNIMDIFQFLELVVCVCAGNDRKFTAIHIKKHVLHLLHGVFYLFTGRNRYNW